MCGISGGIGGRDPARLAAFILSSRAANAHLRRASSRRRIRSALARDVREWTLRAASHDSRLLAGSRAVRSERTSLVAQVCDGL